MDEISRELPPDTTSPRLAEERQKGPEEVQLHERGQVRDDLVVRSRFADDMPEPMDEAGDEAGDDARVGDEPAAEVLPQPPSDDVPQAAAAAAPEALPVEAADAVAPTTDDLVSADAAAAAVAAEAEVASYEEELVAEDGEELPAVPELADARAVAQVVFVLMLTSREGLSLLRLAQACNTTQKLITEALELLQADLRERAYPVELCRVGDTVKWMSGHTAFPYLQRLRGVKKLEKLSPAALETLAVIAYRQPVMRSEIEAIRGVKAGPMLRTLLQHKLVKVTGRSEVPGRPLQYGTTPQFLERFGLGSLQELPSVKEWKNLG
jgi:segregation and condensation protein B